MNMIIMSLLLIVEVVAAFLLIVVILAQKSKDQGLGMAFGGGVGESLFGSRAGNVLTRLTITLAIIFMVDTMLIGILFARGTGTGGSSLLSKLTAATPPAMPAAPAATPAEGMPMDAEFPLEGGDLTIPMEGAAGQPQAFRIGDGGQLVPIEEPYIAPPAIQAEESLPEQIQFELAPIDEEPGGLEPMIEVPAIAPESEDTAPQAEAEAAAPVEEGVSAEEALTSGSEEAAK